MLDLIIPDILINKNLNQIYTLVEKENKKRMYPTKYAINFSLEHLNGIWVGRSHKLVAFSNHFTIDCYSKELQKQLDYINMVEYDNIIDKWHTYIETNNEYYEDGLIYPEKFNIKTFDREKRQYILNDNSSQKQIQLCEILNSHIKYEDCISNTSRKYMENKDNYNKIKCIVLKPDIPKTDPFIKDNIEVSYKIFQDNKWIKKRLIGSTYN